MSESSQTRDPHVERLREAREKVQRRLKERKKKEAPAKGWWSETMDRWAEDEYRERD